MQLEASSPLYLVAQAWLAYLEHRVRQQQRVSHTVSCYRRDVGLLGSLADRPVAEIRPPEIIEWHDSLCATTTSARAYACYNSLRALFGFARRRGLNVSLGVGHHSVETTKKIYARNLVIYPGMFRAAQMVQDARDAAAHEAAIGGGE